MKIKSGRLTYVKNILIPCLFFSVITGTLTGTLIFAFKVAASEVIKLSADVYSFVRERPVFLPLLLAAIAIIALASALILKFSPNLRGGGIPTSIALLRGLISFRWLKSVFLLFGSAMLTFLGGIPLGNEGPSVQMGTAVGRGTVRIFAKKQAAWDRYIMTGGACAGFACATGAPISGIFFALEEAHRRFSPMILMAASATAIAGSITMEALCSVFKINSSLFEFTIENVLPLRFLWAALIVGVACALCAIVFTKAYRVCSAFIKKRLERFPFMLKIIIVFVAVALIGFVSEGFLGSGHSLIDEMIEGHGVWYMLILYICVRAILLIIANNVGVTGGLFVPSLAFGAMIGALCGQAMVALNILPREYYVIMVVIGMASFLGASSRTPMTAIIFSVEALSGLTNIIPIALGVTFAFLMIETVGISSFTETVVEQKVEDENAGKRAAVVDTKLTVQRSSFIVGKEIRDILWPPTCVITSVQKSKDSKHAFGGIAEGDVLEVHYQTYNDAETLALLESIVGKQTGDVNAQVKEQSENNVIPEL